jgi:hypothetical protein
MVAGRAADPQAQQALLLSLPLTPTSVALHSPDPSFLALIFALPTGPKSSRSQKPPNMAENLIQPQVRSIGTQPA